MPTLTYSLSSFTKTNTDMKADTTFTAYASGTPVSNATISSGSLYLSSMKTYSGYCYLTFVLGSGSGTTANFLSNQTVHGETVTLTGYSAGLLTAGSGTITFTVRRSNTGTGNLLNIRDGLADILAMQDGQDELYHFPFASEVKEDFINFVSKFGVCITPIPERSLLRNWQIPKSYREALISNIAYPLQLDGGTVIADESAMRNESELVSITFDSYKNLPDILSKPPLDLSTQKPRGEKG